ncbi:50S ribosomal protein L15 [Aquisphaera insulae]|uniref:50S ribosomal protein L15 n=1 Tax=Aquisphaera insulae TaxID=2712864 RepID=UPI0013EA1317|nr:50S ribosomal protein L15 [Aquisphaera insulae]
MQLHDVHKGVHRRKLKKRVGRGTGSGHGKTSSKGHKGHSSRQGFKLNPIFEGGQMPLARRVPKRGFFNGAFKKEYVLVNLGDLEATFDAGAVIDEAALRARGLVKGYAHDGIKVLADGDLTKTFTVKVTKFSAAAAAKIAATGGSITAVPYTGRREEPKTDAPAKA